MGGRRLSREKALRQCGLALAFLAGLVLAGCPLSGGDDAGPTPQPSAAANPSATTVPTATATPDPLAKVPSTQFEARALLEQYLGPSAFTPPCPEPLKKAGIGCAIGDLDGDGIPDFAYLVPVKPANVRAPFPAAVFVRGSRSKQLEEFAVDMTADVSILGRAFFAVDDRTGDSAGELTFLRNLCSATGCSTLAVIERWDGTAWRDIGPADAGILNVDSFEWRGSGAVSELDVHGGKLPDEAGPSRSARTTFRFEAGRYTPDEEKPDPPEYLYHAVDDADALFKNDLAAAVGAYARLIGDRELKDWSAKPDAPDRRPALKGYALFRIAVARAAQGNDPAAALDAVIRESAEPLFVIVAEEFRKGYQERQGVIAGCAAVNLYLSRQVPGTDTAGYVEKLFDYGYANPPGRTWLNRICPY